MSEAVRKADKQRQTLTQAWRLGQEADIFPDLLYSFFGVWSNNCSFLWGANNTTQPLCNASFPLAWFSKTEAICMQSLHSQCGWVDFLLQSVSFSYIVIMHYYSLGQMNMNKQKILCIIYWCCSLFSSNFCVGGAAVQQACGILLITGLWVKDYGRHAE